MMVFIIADAGREDTPDVAIEAVFSPSRLIGLHRRTGTDLPFERIEMRLHLVFEPMQQLYDLSTADPHPMQGEQVRLDLSNGQTHHRAQRGDQAGQSHAQTSLTAHLVVEIHRSFIPVVAACTPALVDTMFCDLDCWRRGAIDDLPATPPTQPAPPHIP